MTTAARKAAAAQRKAEREVKAKVDAGAKLLREARMAEREARLAEARAEREAAAAAAAIPPGIPPRELDFPEDLDPLPAIEATPFEVVIEAVGDIRAALAKAADAGDITDPAENLVARKACGEISTLAVDLRQKLDPTIARKRGR